MLLYLDIQRILNVRNRFLHDILVCKCTHEHTHTALMNFYDTCLCIFSCCIIVYIFLHLHTRKIIRNRFYRLQDVPADEMRLESFRQQCRQYICLPTPLLSIIQSYLLLDQAILLHAINDDWSHSLLEHVWMNSSKISHGKWKFSYKRDAKYFGIRGINAEFSMVPLIGNSQIRIIVPHATCIDYTQIIVDFTKMSKDDAKRVRANLLVLNDLQHFLCPGIIQKYKIPEIGMLKIREFGLVALPEPNSTLVLQIVAIKGHVKHPCIDKIETWPMHFSIIF